MTIVLMLFSMLAGAAAPSTTTAPAEREVRAFEHSDDTYQETDGAPLSARARQLLKEASHAA